MATVAIHSREVASVLRDYDAERTLSVRLVMLTASDEQRASDLDAWATFNGFSIPAAVSAARGVKEVA